MNSEDLRGCHGCSPPLPKQLSASEPSSLSARSALAQGRGGVSATLARLRCARHHTPSRRSVPACIACQPPYLQSDSLKARSAVWRPINPVGSCSEVKCERQHRVPIQPSRRRGFYASAVLPLFERLAGGSHAGWRWGGDRTAADRIGCAKEDNGERGGRLLGS